MRIKICGLTSVDDAVFCVAAGADAVGLNFWPRSVRRCDLEVAEAIVREIGGRARVVAVLVDAPEDDIARLRELGIAWFQLHGRESNDAVAARLPNAYKAVHVSTEADLERALAVPGDELLVDASLPSAPGGTGTTCDWSLAARVAKRRSVWLAGGLRPGNIASAISAVSPYGVDVASGVESAPGHKDRAAVRAFVEAARARAADTG